jgi:stage II sporulation protein D
MPLPPGLQDQAVSRWALAGLLGAVVSVAAQTNDATIRISVAGRVSSMSLEDYVARVVAGEGQPKAADGAQQALAITARTYALANRNRHRREGFDLCDTTHCQVLRPVTDASQRAARSTAGRVLMFQGQPASVYYSALCGGHSELASQVWPGADDSSSDLHEDEACRDEPAWTRVVSTQQIERALRVAGHRGDRLRELRVIARNESGRVARLRSGGFVPNEISGPDLRSALNRTSGEPIVRSTAFEVRRVGSGYQFTGTGYGHGVGLCVIGAGRRAAQGNSADAILRFYFPRLTVGSSRGVAVRAETAPIVPPVPRDDVVITLAGDQERHRALIAKTVRAARDHVSSRTTRKPPVNLRVTVHATVDAFVRATGQPWWMSGAADGSAIDLVPIGILEQRGQLERAIRHEMAHVFVDPALTGRPQWVREGAAIYFADRDAERETTGGGSCPTDEELLRPVSAGAYRTALARADACFRRALSRGRAWDHIR